MPLGAHKAAIMGVAGTAAAGDVVLLSSQTAASDATLSFTSGIDSTYGEYIFKFYNCNPETDDKNFQIEFSDDGGSSFAVTKTSTEFGATFHEDDSGAELSVDAGKDLAQSSDPQPLSPGVGSGADEHCVGEVHLFNPASTTYVKHYYARTGTNHSAERMKDRFIAGYINTTSAINGARFSFASGDFDGTIKMWGVK